jgi:hypothetical protein
MLAGTPRSHAHDGPLLQPFRTSTDAPKSTTKKWRNIITHHTVSTKAAQLRSASSSHRAASPDVAIHGAEEGAKAGKKRCKQRHQKVATNNNGGTNERAEVERAIEAVGSSKHQARLSMDQFKMLLEETCPNHAYPIKHKLKDYGLMKSFMTTRSLSRGMEVDEAPIEGNAAPFPREDAITMIDGRHPSP